jgi:hypothetical protein
MTEQIPPSDAEFFRQRGFGLKIGFGERPALLVIDMLKAFTNPQMMLGANLDKEIEAIKPLLAIARERDIPIIFSTVIYNDADLKDAGIWALKQKGVVTLKGDSDGIEIDPRLGFRATDSLLVKKYASCFFGIMQHRTYEWLAQRLRRARVRPLWPNLTFRIIRRPAGRKSPACLFSFSSAMTPYA